MLAALLDPKTQAQTFNKCLVGKISMEAIVWTVGRKQALME